VFQGAWEWGLLLIGSLHSWKSTYPPWR